MTGFEGEVRLRSNTESLAHQKEEWEAEDKKVIEESEIAHQGKGTHYRSNIQITIERWNGGPK